MMTGCCQRYKVADLSLSLSSDMQVTGLHHWQRQQCLHLHDIRTGHVFSYFKMSVNLLALRSFFFSFTPFFWSENTGSSTLVITITGTFLNCGDSLVLNHGPWQENYKRGVCGGDSRLGPDLGGLSRSLVYMSPRHY